MNEDLELNQRIAERLREAADLLERQGANPFRIGAYRRAADTLTHLDRDVEAILAREGMDGLMALPGIGKGIAANIAEIVHSGRWAQLDRLRGTADPIALFQTVPGVGPELARNIHDHLHADTLEELELAAHDGRLEQVPGIGTRRAAALRASLEHVLGRVRSRRRVANGPDVAAILDVDREYRDKAEAGALASIVPRRFNPDQTRTLPVLHTQRGRWHFTALYSNTARAHDLGRTRDWVVLYFYDDHHQEGQHTVVTETHGPLIGRRVVRGRESECRRHYGLE
ncbi:MAG: helix-hairpin-helix domain-containing protein [Gammaproteobacteria bacterium]